MDAKGCIVVHLTLCVMCCIVLCSKTDRQIEELKKTAYCTNRSTVYKNPSWNKCLLDDGTSICVAVPDTETCGGNSDTCRSSNSKCFGPNYPGFQDMCFCDQDCAEFGDCCPDIQNRHDSPWMCRPLKYIPNVYIYMNQKCPQGWKDDQVKQLCEYEPDHLWRKGKYYHHLQDIPVYSLDRSIMYRNVFCAVCNNDTNLYTWKTYFDCGDARDENVTITDAVFRPDKKVWTVPDKNITCSVMVDELRVWNNVSMVYNGRRCRGISKCSPSWDGSDEKLKCDPTTEDQYMYYSTTDGTLFKNPHCALCNYLTITSLTCKPVVQTQLGDGSILQSKVWYPIILDFNFHGDSEQLCYTDELYDPILKACLQLSCGKSYVRIGDKCVATDKNGTDLHLPDCFKITLDGKYFVVLANDTIYVNHSGKYYAKDEYEPVLSDGKIIKILICTDEVISFNFSPVQYWLSEIGLILSITCLLIHLTVYLILPKLHNLPGKILISLSVSLLIAQLFFLLGSYTQGTNTWYCIAFGVITHFSHLSAFFWMNVMAFDVCRTFCISRPRSEHSNTFLKYSSYGWLSPTLIVLLSLVLNFVSESSLYSPQYGKNSCWISQKRALLIFFALPISVVLLSNFILFFITARSLSKTAQETKLANKFSDRVRFFLYVKLALILGLTWIFGFIATLTKLSYLWYPFIVFNTLQGAFILLSFTVKKNTWKYFKERLHIKEKKTTNIGYMRQQCTSTSNLSTIQTSLSSTLSASVPVLCHQKDIVHAMVNGNLKPMSKKSMVNFNY